MDAAATTSPTTTPNAPKRRSRVRSVVRWLPVIATVILAIFAVVQAFGKMH